MGLLKNWKIHLLCLLITLVAEGIGIQKFGIVVFLPLLYSLVIGLVISIPKLKIVTEEQMVAATDYLNISIMILMTKIGLGIGPNLHIIMNSGWALILQELGHFFGTIVLGLPIALLVGMRREAVGGLVTPLTVKPMWRLLLTATDSIHRKVAALWACTFAVLYLVLCGFPYWPA